MTVFGGHLMAWVGCCLSIGRLWVPFGLAVLAATCASTSGHGAATTVTRVEAGVYSALGERAFLVIESSEDFARWYQDLHAHRLPPPAVPRIDFRQHLVLVVAMGHRSTGGYSIRIADAALDGDTIRVSIVGTSTCAGNRPDHGRHQPLRHRNCSPRRFCGGLLCRDGRTDVGCAERWRLVSRLAAGPGSCTTSTLGSSEQLAMKRSISVPSPVS